MHHIKQKNITTIFIVNPFRNNYNRNLKLFIGTLPYLYYYDIYFYKNICHKYGDINIIKRGRPLRIMRRMRENGPMLQEHTLLPTCSRNG